MTSPEDKWNAVCVENWRKRVARINPLREPSAAERSLFYRSLLGVRWLPKKIKDVVSEKGLGISVGAQNAYALQGWARQTRFNIKMRMQRMKQNGERPLLGRRRIKTATGGLLRQIGERGILVIKDVTSILSMHREMRSAILAALREIHDGYWVRNVGSDGGQTLEWRGRIAVIGACTTAWDQAHSVIATMGDRFVLIRSNSHLGRIGGGLRAIRNTGEETNMREELAAAVAGLVNNINTAAVYSLTESDENIIVEAADIITRARTGVEQDYRGDVIDAHQPEMPTRFAKQLTQIMRAAIAIGMSQIEALRLVIRCARDSMPPLRLAVLHDVAVHPDAPIIDVRRRLQKPRATIDRTLQALHILGLLTCREEEEVRSEDKRYHRHYTLADGIDLAVLDDPTEGR